MLKDVLDGFCMALADSVPGVSGGTVAFLLGFYDRMIGSINRLVFGKKEDRKESVVYLLRLGTGWIVGMVLAVLVLSALFESHIYLVSSLFIGFIAASIPLIIKEEKQSFRQVKKGIWFCLLGIGIVAAITWMNGKSGNASMDLSHFTLGLGSRLLLIGMAAVSAMFLPGISGSTLLLIFGAYIPVISALRGVLKLEMAYVPALIFFGAGVLAGAVSVVKGIKICLEKFRPQMVYLILGMMLGSFYAIVQGPATLTEPQSPINPGNFQMTACIIGGLLVLGIQLIKEKNHRKEMEKNGNE